MRISSKFKDYYDHMQQFVYGSSYMWTRACCNVKDHKLLNTWPKNDTFQPIVIGFCGNLYGLALERWQTYDVKTREYTNYEHIHTSKPQTINTRIGYADREIDPEYSRRLDKIFFKEKNDDIFIKENAPIFIFTTGLECKMPVYPTDYCGFDVPLSDFRFEELVPAENAYNEIISYVDFLGQEHKSVPEMSNETKIESHGFTKDSFRGK